MKRIAILALILVTLLTACDPAPPAIKVQYNTPSASPTVQTPEPSASSSPVVTNTPEASQSGESVNLTDKQKDKIIGLLDGAINMSDYCTDNATFFQDVSSLTTEDFLYFVYIILDNKPDSIGRKYMDTGTVSSKDVENIIRSAFGVDYIPKEGDNAGEGLNYSGGSFEFGADDGVFIGTWPYSFTRQTPNSLIVKFNMIFYGVPTTEYKGKGEAVLQEDANSLFGYRLVSLTKADEPQISTGVKASSSLPADGSKTYAAANAIDGSDSTAWVTKNGKGEWIKLSFDKPQNISGLVLHFGDWSSDDAFDEHAKPSSCVIEFSDGTSVIDKYCEPNDIDDDSCFTFDKIISTSYVKITITDITEDSGGGVYVSEIKPF